MLRVPLFQQATAPEPPPFEPERRGQRRLQPYWINCDLGYIIDVSAEGVRLLTKRRLSGFVRVRLWDERNGFIHDAEVKWSKKIRWRQHEVGLHFVGLTPERALQLAKIAVHVR